MIVSRTDDLRAGGASERGGSVSGAPFVKWGDEYTWLEGEVTGTFKTKYGLAATFKVHRVCDNGLSTQGRDEDGNHLQGSVRAGEEVNIGMGSATLEDKITEEDVGKNFHVSFSGLEAPKGGNRYRLFAVVELTDRPQRSGEGLEQRETVPASDPGDHPIEDTSGF